MSDNMTPSEFQAKIDWEGGAFEAYEYGLRGSHLAPEYQELADAWQAFVDAMDDATDQLYDFEYTLEKFVEREEEL